MDIAIGMSHVRLFLSAVTDEFESYRDGLREQLQRPNVTVHVQDDFIATGTETLDKLDAYIRDCDAVIHLVGDMTGAWATAATLQALRSRYLDLASISEAIPRQQSGAALIYAVGSLSRGVSPEAAPDRRTGAWRPARP
jgi:hypothetical protein